MNSDSESDNNSVDVKKEGRTKDCSGVQPALRRLHSPFTFSLFLSSLESASAAVRSLKLCSHRFLRLKTELYTSFSAISISCHLNWWRACHSLHYPAQKDSFLVWTSHMGLYYLFSAVYIGLKTDGASLITQLVKNLPAVQETWVWSLGEEEPLEKGMATLSSILAWRIPWMEEPGGLQFVGSHRVRHNRATDTAATIYIYVV